MKITMLAAKTTIPMQFRRLKLLIICPSPQINPQNNNINTQTQLLQTQLAFVLFANWQLQTQLAVARNENWQLRAQLGFVQYCNQNTSCVPTVQPKNNNHIQTDNWVIAVATAASPAADTLDGQLRDRLQAIGSRNVGRPKRGYDKCKRKARKCGLCKFNNSTTTMYVWKGRMGGNNGGRSACQYFHLDGTSKAHSPH